MERINIGFKQAVKGPLMTRGFFFLLFVQLQLAS